MLLYDTLRAAKRPFTPADPSRVTMYVCGPTVYGPAHIGNMRPAVVFDVLARVLRLRCPRVDYVRNVTDVDDKIIAAARDAGCRWDDIALAALRGYHDDLAALGVEPPTAEPRVSTHIAPIIDMIQRLIRTGHAYVAEGHVLFDVPSCPGYGQLSKRGPAALLAGARVEVAPYKRDAGDFVLWKPLVRSWLPPREPAWPSPWGAGRPGWHIECSAMARQHLGDTIDIHGGGHDLVFPHHENERAQSMCANGGHELARYWVHNGHVTVGGAKMSKSIGNVLLVRDLLDRWPGEAIRLTLLSARYSRPLDWTGALVNEAVARLDRLYRARGYDPLPALAPAPAVVAALEDDLNTPAALAALSDLASRANKASGLNRIALRAELAASGALLGILQEPAAWFASR